MTEQALVSIVVPIYNRHKYLDTCLKSILNQTYQNLEIILVDDGSTDDSLKICERYASEDSRIKIIRNNHAGVSMARNSGIENASGKYTVFIDSDDTVAKEHCEYAVGVLEKFKADICCMKLMDVNDKAKETKAVIYNQVMELSKEQAMELLINDGYLCDKVYKTNLLKRHPFPKGKMFEDTWTLHYVFDEADKIVYSPVTTYFYEVRNDSIMTNMSSKTIADQFESSNDRYSFFKKNYPTVAPKMNVYMLIRALRYCTYCPKNYNRQLFDQAKTIIKTSPVDPNTLDRRYQITMKLFRFSEPLALLIFRLRKLTNSQT